MPFCKKIPKKTDKIILKINVNDLSLQAGKWA